MPGSYSQPPQPGVYTAGAYPGQQPGGQVVYGQPTVVVSMTGHNAYVAPTVYPKPIAPGVIGLGV